MSDTTKSELVALEHEAIRKALAAGPTPGPWNHVTFMSGTQNVEFPGARGVTFIDEVRDADVRAICSDNDTKPFPWMDIHHRPEDRGDDSDPQRTKNARFIAACNPEAIAALLADRDRLATALAAVPQIDERAAFEACRLLVAYDECDYEDDTSMMLDYNAALSAARAAVAQATPGALTSEAEDAARYRWLRNRLPGSAYRIAGVIYSEGGAGVDAAIDAARTASLGPKP